MFICSLFYSFLCFFCCRKKIRFQEKPKKPSKWKKPNENNNSSKKKREQTNEWIATKRQIVKPKPLWLANVHIYIFHLFVLYVRFVFFAFNVCLLLYVCIRMPMHRAKAMAPRAPNVYCVVYDCAFVWNSKSNIRNVTVHFNSNTMCFTYLTVRIFALNYISFFSCISFPILSHAHVHRRFSPCSILFTWCVSWICSNFFGSVLFGNAIKHINDCMDCNNVDYGRRIPTTTLLYAFIKWILFKLDFFAALFHFCMCVCCRLCAFAATRFIRRVKT